LSRLAKEMAGNKRELSPEEQREIGVCSYWNMKFKESMITKAPYTKLWASYWDAYRGDYFKDSKLPDYKSNLVSNYIYSIIETIRPIMFDNDPKYQAVPRQPEGMEFSNDWEEVLIYEWDRENMSVKTVRDAITMLVTGNTVYFVPWDARVKNVKAVSTSPDNIYPDPLATSVEDAGYIIYAKYVHMNKLKKMFPSKAGKFTGSSVNYSELVQHNDQNAKVNDQVLVLEVWAREHEANVPNQEQGSYPKGRVLTLCPEIGVVLEDKENPYDDGDLPFVVVKDYDIPDKFWGEGEVAQLLSPQKYMNEMSNAIIDNAKTTANSPWIIDKNSGIGEGKITSRPGLVIRKNPGSEVRREQPSNMPNYVPNTVDTLKNDMEQVSGIFDSIKGNSETGVYTAQGILALQEAGQARIRLKVKLYEYALTRLAKLWSSRIRQFWKEQRYIGITRFDGTYDVKQFRSQAIGFEFDVKITAGSTMPVNRSAMLDLMIRLAQTPMPDGQNIVDREAVVQYLPEEAKSAILKRMADKQDAVTQQLDQITQEVQQVQQNDQSVLQTIDGLTTAVEKLKQEILQLGAKHDKLEKDKVNQENLNKQFADGYNKGYDDSSKLASPMDASSQKDPMMQNAQSGLDDMQGTDAKLPNDILEGLQGMSDQELQLLIQQHPEFSSLIK
jgi:hypothetical protein